MRIARSWLAQRGVPDWIHISRRTLDDQRPRPSTAKPQHLNMAARRDRRQDRHSVTFLAAALTRMCQATDKLSQRMMDITGFRAELASTFSLRDGPVANSHSQALTDLQSAAPTDVASCWWRR